MQGDIEALHDRATMIRGTVTRGRQSKMGNHPWPRNSLTEFTNVPWCRSFGRVFWMSLEEIAEGTGGTLFITKADLQYWTASPGSLERAGRVVNKGLFWRGQMVSRALTARHAGFLTELELSIGLQK